MAQFTKNAIMRSFLKLLNERPLDKITVKDIVEDCGVSRNSFYYYFRDLYDLLDEIFLQETKKAIDEPYAEASWQERLIRSLQFVMSNRKMVFHVIHSVSRDRVEDYLYSVSDKIMRDYVEQEAANLPCGEEDKRFITHFYKYAVVGMFLEWAESGMKQEPQQYITRIGQLFEGNIREALLRSCEPCQFKPAEVPQNGTQG